MSEQLTMLPAPMLIIAVGNFAQALLTSVQELFRGGKPGRLMTVAFYKVSDSRSGDEDLKLEAMLTLAPDAQPPVPYARAGMTWTQGPALGGVGVVGSVRAQASSSLEAVLHDLRLHEKFLEIGLGDQQDLPLGVIVLADLTEPGSELLYLVTKRLREKMAEEPGSYLYVLCKTASFEGNPEKNLMQARLHLHLRELKKLAQEFGPGLQTYLFDSLKEGPFEAKDADEIGVLMQNFLLALLSNRLAQRLAHTQALADGNKGEVFFSSAGATSLIYDSSAVQDICAMQLAVEILRTEFLARGTIDPAQMEVVVKGVLERAGEVSAWAKDLCADTPFRALPAENIKLDLHFSDLQFEGLPPQEWGDAIVGYAEYFHKELQAIHLETVQRNAVRVGQAIGTAFEAELQALPARSTLFPGGIANALGVIQGCVQEISQRIRSLESTQEDEETLRLLEREYVSAIEALDLAIENLPEPPRWMKRLPEKLYTYATMLFEVLFLRRELTALVVLREKIVQTLEAKFILEFQRHLGKSIVELCNQLITSLEDMQSALNKLQEKCQNVKKHAEDCCAALPGQASHSFPESSPFCIQILTPTLLQWAYARSAQNVDAIRTKLLEDGLLENWYRVSDEYLYSELVSVCRGAYEWLHDLNVEDILKETRSPDLSTTLVSLTQGTIPALRPDFDLSGENISFSANYFLCADPRNSDIPGTLKASTREWQQVATGDLSMVLFCRVRQMIPVSALSLLLQSSQVAFESLEEREQKEMQEAFLRWCS